MAISTFLILISAVFAITSTQRIPAHAVTSIMQDILSPKNTERLSTLIQNAANGRMPELQMLNKRNVIKEVGPRNQARTEMIPKTVVIQNAEPTKLVMQRTNADIITSSAVTQNAMPKTILVRNQNEAGTPVAIVVRKEKEPAKIVIKNPEVGRNVLVQKPEVTNRRILVQKANEIPMLRNLMQNAVLVSAKEAPISAPRGVEYVSEKVVAPSPYLPLASPGAAVSNAVPKSRGQFLRKIPIPPPTI